MGTTTGLESIKDLILRMTKEAWDDRKEGVLLARLGEEARKRPELAKSEMAGRTLSVFIKEEMGAEIELFRDEKSDVLRLALPRSAGVAPADASKHFPKAAASKKAVQASGVTSAVRLAFSRELAAGKKRFIILSPKVRFVDIDEGADPPSDAKNIPRSLIASESQNDEEQVRLILNNIAQWREQEQVEPEAVAKKTKADEAQGRNVLDLLLTALTEAELKRIELPLDIVAKLRGTGVK